MLQSKSRRFPRRAVESGCDSTGVAPTQFRRENELSTRRKNDRTQFRAQYERQLRWLVSRKLAAIHSQSSVIHTTIHVIDKSSAIAALASARLRTTNATRAQKQSSACASPACDRPAHAHRARASRLTWEEVGVHGGARVTYLLESWEDPAAFIRVIVRKFTEFSRRKDGDNHRLSRKISNLNY